MRKLLTTATVAMLTMTVSVPVLAQQASPKNARDPNEIVCERQEEIGSRLGGERVCKTRAQWAEERRAAREDVDKAQMQRDLNHPQ